MNQDLALFIYLVKEIAPGNCWNNNIVLLMKAIDRFPSSIL